MNDTLITGIGICCVFAHDYAESFRFYHEVLELSNVTTMNENSCYFSISESVGLYLVGGHQLPARDPKSVGLTFAFSVTSITEVFNRMIAIGMQVVQNEPMQMNENDYWFQCFDPSGNLIEFIGGK